MQNIGWIIVGILGGGILAYFLFARRKQNNSEDGTGFSLLLQQMNELQKTVDQKLGESHKQVSESLKFHSSESNKIIRDVTEK